MNLHFNNRSLRPKPVFEILTVGKSTHMKKIFISRDLDEDSIFKKMLSEYGFEVIGTSLVEFKAANNSSIPEADWVFFYSKNAVHFFLNMDGIKTWKPTKTAAIGPGTAEALLAAGIQPNFVGDGNPVSTAAAFLTVANGCTVLFPQASDSRQSIQKMLQGQIESTDLIVYENKPKGNFQVPHCQALVFTSPLNARTYFSKHEHHDERIFAIGNTTADALRQLNILQYVVSELPSEEALAELVISLLGESCR